jgi:hypothetical protein
VTSCLKRLSLRAVMGSVAVVLSTSLQGPAECTVDVSCEQTLQTHLIYHSKAACKQTCGQQDGSGPCAAEAPAADSPCRDAGFCCLLGTASEPGAPYDVTTSGPPLPGCEADRWVWLSSMLPTCTTGLVEALQKKSTKAQPLCHSGDTAAACCQLLQYNHPCLV